HRGSKLAQPFLEGYAQGVGGETIGAHRWTEQIAIAEQALAFGVIEELLSVGDPDEQPAGTQTCRYLLAELCESLLLSAA
ncbi:MAG: hypothetical protein V3V65_08680, partial [Hyphomicrobium sp.]